MVRSREVVVAQVVLHRIPLVAGIIASQFKNGAPTLSSRFRVLDHMQVYCSEIFTIIQALLGRIRAKKNGLVLPNFLDLYEKVNEGHLL